MPVHLNSAQSLIEQQKKGSTEAWRRRVFDCFSDGTQSLEQWTDREVMKMLAVTDPNFVRPEITRLIYDGILREAGKTKCRITGKTVRFCEWTMKEYFSRGNKKGVGKR